MCNLNCEINFMVKSIERIQTAVKNNIVKVNVKDHKAMTVAITSS